MSEKPNTKLDGEVKNSGPVYRQPKLHHIEKTWFNPEFGWEICHEDPTNKHNILVWRRISEFQPEDALEMGNLSYRAGLESGQRPEMKIREVFRRLFEGQNIKDVAASYITSSGVHHEEPSPVLHTTYDPSNAVNIPYQGVVLEYSVPKQWILDHEDEIFVTTGGETELGFFHGLPEDSLKSIRYRNESGDEITETIDMVRSRVEAERNKRNSPSDDTTWFEF